MIRFARRFSIEWIISCALVGSLAAQVTQVKVPPKPLTPEQQQQFTTVNLYSYFFHRVEAVEALAQRSEAAGTDKHHLTRKLMLQNDSQLNDSEFAAVRAIALDHNAKRDAALQQWKDAVGNFRQANGADAKPFASPELRKQHNDTNKFLLQNSLDHIAQIKAALGDSRFEQFDQWVRTKPTTPALGSK